MPRLKTILWIKIGVLVACGIIFYSSLQASDKLPSVTALPTVPSGPISLSEAAGLRTQLELLKQDVEQKITKLAIAKKAYDVAKVDIEQKLKRVEEERTFLKETLQQEKKSKEERLGEALEFVAKMDPRKAGPVVEGMDRDLVLHLFRKLPPRQVTKILESVNPKKATELMEYYTRIRSGREFELMQQMGLCQSSEKEDDENKKSNEPAKPTGSAPATAKP